MRFYFPQRFPSVLLLLVALTCAAQAGSLRGKRSVWNDIGNTLNNIGQTIKDTTNTVKTKIDSLFHHRDQHSTTEPEMIPTLAPAWNETTSSSESNGTDFRTFITFPIRCPPDHVVVKNRCRIEGR